MKEHDICASCGEEKEVGGYDELGFPWCWGCWNELLSAIGGYDSDDLDEGDEDGICLIFL